MDFNSFIAQYFTSDSRNATHRSLAGMRGNYCIPDDKLDELYEIIINCPYPTHLLEVPTPESSNIKIDIDLRFPNDVIGRKYKPENIISIVELYNQAICKFLKINESQLKAFVFERDAPYKDKGNLKDGIHIMYPDIICNTKYQFEIRNYVIEHSPPIFTQIGAKNAIEDIIDKRIIATNGWMLYGCSKQNLKPYKLTYVIDSELNQLNISHYMSNLFNLTKLLSIRKTVNDINAELADEYNF